MYFIRDITRDKDKALAADFIISCINQEGSKPNTRRVYVRALAYLCRYLAKRKEEAEEKFSDKPDEAFNEAHMSFRRRARAEQPDKFANEVDK